MNGTNYVSLTWKGGLNGIYVFTAQVLDAEYSHCNLTTTFAVELLKAPISWVFSLLITLGVVVVGIIGLIVCYFIYAQKQKQAKEKMD